MEKERDYKKKLDNLTAEQSNIMTDLSGQKNQELEDQKKRLTKEIATYKQ